MAFPKPDKKKAPKKGGRQPVGRHAQAVPKGQGGFAVKLPEAMCMGGKV